MKRAPIGAVVALYYDDPQVPLAKGHVIRTPSGRCYRVASLRVTKRGIHTGRRWYLTAHVVDPGTVSPTDVIHPLNWYPRNSRTHS